MPGTATNYDIPHIHQGPGDLWVIGGGVADSATPQLTIATDGTPDSTAHPASIHLGAFPEGQGLTLLHKPKIEDIKVEQADTAVDRFYVSGDMSIEADLAQIDPTVMQTCLPYAVFSTASGYSQLTFGNPGSGILASPCIAMIAKKRAVAGKFIVTVLFKATGTMGWSTVIGRAKASSFKAKFDGLADMTRTQGRQVGVYYETK